MTDDLLTTASMIECRHGGDAILSTQNERLYVADQPVLLESDVHGVVGCPHRRGQTHSPCVTITWSGGAESLLVDGDAVLTTSSVGTGRRQSGVGQGQAVIRSTQGKMAAR